MSLYCIFRVLSYLHILLAWAHTIMQACVLIACNLLCWLENSIACWVEAIKCVLKEVMQKEHNLNGRLLGAVYNEAQSLKIFNCTIFCFSNLTIHIKQHCRLKGGSQSLYGGGKGNNNNKMAAMICSSSLKSNQCGQHASITYYQVTCL